LLCSLERHELRRILELERTPMTKIRLNLQVSEQLNKDLEEIADSAGTNRTEVIRQALALMKVAHQARREGRHLGLVSDASKLDTELVGLL
jgi:metal-responsive CopG/Arc/MetJ family transcriptional regulator